MPASRKIIVIFLALFLCFMFSPLASPIITTGSAYALGWHPPPPSGTNSGGGSGGHSSAPEPATWLLIGAGAAGLVLLRKKFKK